MYNNEDLYNILTSPNIIDDPGEIRLLYYVWQHRNTPQLLKNFVFLSGFADVSNDY